MLTGNHRLPTEKNYHNGKFDIQEDNYTFVSKLKKWDFVPTILGYESFGQEFTYEESKLLWYLIGDGSLSSTWISITKYDKRYVDVIQKLVENTGLTSWYNEEKQVINIQKSEFLMKKSWLYHSKSADKKIPAQMFGECENNKRAIIEWLMNTDGYIQIKWWKKWKDLFDRKKSICIEYCSISEELIKGMHILLNDLGVVNYYNKKLKKIRLSTLKTDEYEAYYLYITDVDSLKVLFNNCDLWLKKNFFEAQNIVYTKKGYTNSTIGTIPLCSIKEKTAVSNDWGKTLNWIRYPRYNYQRYKAINYWVEHRLNYQWSQVVSVEIMYEQEVVDIETDGNSLYWIETVLSHNSGKSWLMVYIAIRQIFLPWQMILYMLPVKEDYSEQPFFYIEQMVENIKKSGAELEWFQFNSKLFKCTNKIFKSKIIFLSAQGSSKGKSFSANLGIMDEAAYIENGNIYDQLSNSTSDTKGRMRATSTINIDTPINRFFYKKISLDWMEDCKVHSIDIYNNPFMSELEKKRKEAQFKDKNQKVWLADWMAIFVWGADGFDISTFFQISFNYDVVTFKWCRFNLARDLDKYSRFIMCYDPAKNMDRAGLVILWQIWSRCETVLTWYVDIKNYFLQWEVIIEILEYIGKIKTCEYAIDLGKAGEAAFDYFESRKYSPYGILSTGGATINKTTFRRWNVPTVNQEQTLHTMLAAGIVKWFSWLDFIRNEFETYNLAKERQWNLWHHHDVISALMMWVFIWYERWLISFDKKAIKQANEEVLVDANGMPFKMLKKWMFDGTFLWKFMH